MKYTLITRNGKIMTFYVEAMATLYQEINGGVVFTQQILEEVDNSANMDYTVLID
jgi:hypothetical protein